MFVVSGVEKQRVVNYGKNRWIAELNNITWKIDGGAELERQLLNAVVSFDWARTCDYSEEQLKVRLEKINWDQNFLQSAKNDERRKNR